MVAPFMAQTALQDVEAVPGHRDYLSVIFRRCVLALAGASVPEGTGFHKDVLERMVDLAEEYVTDMVAHLCRVSHMQRRTKPSMADLALVLHFKQLNVLDLIAEAERTPVIEESGPVATLNGLYFDPEEAELDGRQRPFFERHAQLVKSARPTPACIPSWMPDLPPEHTYKHTPSHSSRVRDLRTVRMSLVDEGRLAERALQRLLGDRGSSSIIELPRTRSKPTQSMVVLGSEPNGANEANGANGADTLMAPRDAHTARTEHTDTHTPTDARTNTDAHTEHTDSMRDSNAMEDTNDATHTTNATHTTDTPTSDAPTAPVPTGGESKEPLRIQLHLAKDPPPVKKLSLKLSLGKQKKKAGVVGKRPRTDIAVLAQQAAHREQAQAEQRKDEPEPEPDATKTLAAALASYTH